MFEIISLEQVNKSISYSGKEQGSFKGNEDIPLTQSRGVTALCKILSSRKYAYLADEVGMGKTYQALGVITMLLAERPRAKILIIAPSKNVQDNWEKEINRFRDNNLLIDVSLKDKFYERPKDFISDCVNGAYKEHNIYVLRLTSFSSAAANVARGACEENNYVSRRVLREAIESVTESELPSSIELNQLKYDSSEAGRICAEAFNRITPRFDLVVIDEAQNIRNLNNATLFLNAWLGYKRFETVSSSIATKTLLMSATPAHRNVETLKNQLKYFLSEDKIPQKLSHDYLEEFMIRRLRTYKNENKYECRQNLADDVGKDISIEQRLFLALIQKKLADYKLKNNANYKIGFLETFESFDPTDEGEPEEGEDSRSIKEFENGNSHEKDEYGQAVDKKIMRDVAESFRNEFEDEDFPPHPKLDYMKNKMVTAYKNTVIDEDNCPDKAIVFVRRIASVQELQRRLSKKYEDRVINYWLQKLNIKDGSFRDMQVRFEQNYNKSIGGKQPADDMTDDDPFDSETYELSEQENKSQLLKWLALKKSDKNVTYSAVSRFKKSLQRNRSNCDFFEENYIRTIYDLQRAAGKTKRSYSQYIKNLVDDRFVNEVAKYIDAKPEYYYRKSSGNKGNKYNKSNILVLCCYIAIKKTNPNLASQIFEYYKINEKSADPNPNAVVKKNIIQGILKGTSIWNKILVDNAPLVEATSTYESFCKRELMKKCIQKYLLLGDAILEILYAYCSINKNGTTNDAMDLFVRNNWIKKTEISVRIRQFISNYDLIHSQLFSDIKEKIDIAYNPRFLNDQRWVVGATGGTDNSAVITRFNTPFFPDIIVCTDVMKEGINLHLFCNKVFHYGLAWTPGDLEQRVGRVDRFFSKTFRARNEEKDMKVEITYPYMGKTIDEHQLKKVLGFKIVVDPLLDYTTTKNIDVDSLESTSVEELASFVPDDSNVTNTPYSGKRYWGE